MEMIILNDNILSIQDLNLSFGNKTVLHHISFNIKKGHIIGLIGANGAGKTTIMKSILGITNFSGEILINKHSISKVKHQGLESVGALIEYPGLYPYLSGRQQLELFATGKDRKNRVTEVLHKLDMNSYADIKTKNYSLGMKQKLGIGLAVLNRPKLVILDEPMNGLDPKANKILRDLIINEKEQGVSFLISSHILSELQRIADDVVIIDHGKVITNTDMSHLLSLDKPSYLIQTSDDALAMALLSQNQIPFKIDKGLLIQIKNQFSINEILKLFIVNKIKILDIKQQTGNLETSLFEILSNTSKKVGGQ